MTKPKQAQLLDDLPITPEDHWQGMPEFEQDDLRPARVINVRFRNQADVDAFAELIGQTITPKQKALWFPHMPNRIASDKVYSDEP